MKRAGQAGFTLIESLVAFAILSVVLGVSYVAIAQNAARKARVVTDLEMARLGRAVLTEYAITWPEMPTQGQLGTRWRWNVQETALPQGKQERDLAIRYIRLDVVVTDLSENVPDFHMSTATLRRVTR